MRFVGIDPGLATIGLAVIDRLPHGRYDNVDWLTIRTRAGMPIQERLAEIEKDLMDFLQETKPHMAVIERLFFATNERTAIDVAQARGVILLCVNRLGIEIMEPTPLQLKHAIAGDGRAEKQQVQTMLPHLLPITEIPRPDDAADAVALALYGAIQHGPLRTLQNPVA